MLERIGEVAYRLRLPESSRIHPVFHISQLWKVVGNVAVVSELPPTLSPAGEFVTEPESILETHYTENGHLEALVAWRGLPKHESSWMLVREAAISFFPA